MEGVYGLGECGGFGIYYFVECYSIYVYITIYNIFITIIEYDYIIYLLQIFISLLIIHSMSLTSTPVYASLSSAASAFKDEPKLHLRELLHDSERVGVMTTTHESEGEDKVRIIIGLEYRLKFI